MKKLISSFLLPLLLVCSGCELSDPLNPNGQGNESNTDTPVDPVTPDTSIEDPFVPEDDEDAIANTTFDRTITIVYAAAGATVSGETFFDGMGAASASGGSSVTLTAYSGGSAMGGGPGQGGPGQGGPGRF